MKKFFYIALALLAMSLFVSNISETEFLYIIDNNTDPESEFFSERLFKNAKAIIKPNGKYFSPEFNLNFTNLGLFSIANIESGWAGNLRIDGLPLNDTVYKKFSNTYILVFGKIIKI